MDGEHKNRKNVPFIVVCALLSLSAALCFIDMHYVLDNIHNDAIAFPNVLVGITTFLDAVFLVALVVKGLGLYRGDRADTSDMVNKCQSLAIAAAGFCVIDWIVDALADNVVDLTSLLESVFVLFVIHMYYRIVGRMEHTTFWDGIRVAPQLSPYLAIGDVATELTLDPSDGFLSPCKEGETPCVTVLTAEEYFKVAPVRIVQQMMHTINNVRRSTCIQIGDLTFGNVFIPAEVQRAAGFDTNKNIGFSYQFLDGHLILVMPEEGAERVFLAQALVDQYLEKTTSISFIGEMITTFAVRISDWIRMYEDRLYKLEAKLDDNLYEMPKGFSEYVSKARHELGAIQGFCRQTGDMLEDLTQVASAGGYERAALQCASISRIIARLANDAEEVRDLAGEIRAGYQERIEVRQNDVMSMLTIVETVFTPLALVTGWYGMNFVNMPELKHPDAYFIVAAILIFFIAVEFSIFKRRRWF